MSIAVHGGSELGKVALIVIGVVAFVVIALTWVPEMIAPSGESAQQAPSVGSTVRMVN
jgi:hypothetical protein